MPIQKREEESEETMRKRWRKKKDSITNLANNIQKLRYNITTDLKSDNEKTFLTALAIDIMLATGERVGNNESADAGHFGVTGFKKTHLSIEGNKATFKYKGKSGVDHDKAITDERLASNIKKAKEISPTRYLLCTSDGFRINSDRINRYLSDYEITAKDLRGFFANKLIINKLKDIEPGENENERKKQFNKIAKSAALKVGHGTATLKKHYMIPKLETDFISFGKIIEIKKLGGKIRTRY